MIITEKATQGEIQSNVQRLVRQEEKESREWKKITLGVLTSFLALTFSYFFYNFLSESGEKIWASLISLVLFSIFFLLSVVLTEDKKVIFSFVFAESVLASIFFLIKADLKVSSVAFFFLLIFLSWAVFSGKAEEDSYLKLRFFRTGKMVMVKFMTGISIFAALSYISVILSGSVNLISKGTFYSFLEPSVSFVDKFYPGFSFNKTLRENIGLMVEREINKGGTTIYSSPEEKSAIINGSIIQVEKNFSDFLGISLNTKEKTSDLAYSVISLKFSELIEKYGYVVYLFIAALIFLLLKGFGPFFYWPVLLISFFIYQILRALGFFAILLETRSKETIYMK